jgi:RNA polymerase sigma factor (sigma-70 family)
VVTADVDPGSVTPTGDLEDRDWALSLLTTLPPRQRVAVVLRVLDDHDYADVAAVLGVSETNARKLTSRGLAALRARLEERS